MGLELPPFPDLSADDQLIAYAALVGYLSAKVPAEVYADGVIRARTHLVNRARTQGNAAHGGITLVPLVRFDGGDGAA